ncbi:hypothetical protein V5O48_011897 [Marasmius crinis-equi]|uniref:C2H2-type domain-containing protein n=1 Tax=Marasmius crinis-equi TaxID=585013 RepID=A0ABR3F4L0_9AGAR
MSRSSVGLWRSARSTIGVPEPPENLSEPAFANLLFEARCSFCLAANARNIYWNALCRACKNCTSQLFATQALIQMVIEALYIPPELWKTLPWCNIKIKLPYSGERVDVTHFRVDAAEELSRKYGTIPEFEKQAWIRTKIENAQVLQQSIDRCIEWHNERECARDNASQAARAQRYNDIVERLGGSDLSTQRPEFRGHKLVNQPKPLTERTWKTIRPQLEQLKVEIKSQLLTEYAETRYERLKDILRETERTLPLNLIMPSDADIAFSEPFKTVIESSLELGTDRAIFDDVAQGILKYISDWNQTRTQIALRALQAHLSGATLPDLYKCTSLFKCAAANCGGSRVYTFPAILTHQCLSTSSLSLPKWADFFRGKSPMTTTDIQVDTRGMRRTQDLAHLCGINPSMTLASNLSASGPLMECITCGTPELKHFLHWKSIVSHEAHEFRTVPKEHLDIILRAERGMAIDSQARRDGPNSVYALRFERYFIREHTRVFYSCKHCCYRGSEQEVRAHAVNSHDISSATTQDLERVELGPLHGREVPVKASLFNS